MVEIEIPNEEAMLALGGRLATCAKQGGLIFLSGDLGTGKTTIVRGLIRALGWSGKVKSPTFTIVEPYELGDINVYHFDLYRLADAEELEYMGIRDYLQGGNLCLIEWPERGAAILPNADLTITIEHMDQGRKVIFHSLGHFSSCIEPY